MKEKMRPWGETVLEEKIKAQNERGVIHGGRFSKAKEITDKTKLEARDYLERQVFPKIKKNTKMKILIYTRDKRGIKVFD